MKKKIYELYFKDKKEIKEISKITCVSDRYIRTVLNKEYENIYIKEKELRRLKKLERRKKKKSSINQNYIKRKKVEDNFDYEIQSRLKAKDFAKMRQQRIDGNEVKNKYISDLAFIKWNGSAYKTNKNGVKVFDKEKYGYITRETAPVRYDHRIWDWQKVKSTKAVF